MAPRRRASASSDPPEGAIRLNYDCLGTLSLSALITSAPEVLQEILRSAPPGRTTSPLPVSRDECLSAVLALRDQLLASTYMPPAQDSSALEKLVSMTGAEVMEIGNTDPQRLIALMRSAARHDPTLSPMLPEDADGGVASMTAMAWKLSATEEALNRVTGEGQNATTDNPIAPHQPEDGIVRDRSPSILALLQGGLAVPPTSPQQDLAMAISEEPPPNQRRVLTIGGVPVRKCTSIPDSQEVGQVCRQGLGGSSLIVPSQLGVYPGRGSSTATLRVNEIAGPSILLGPVQEGLNVELAIRNRSWKRGNGGEVLASEAEALTLARIVHLNLLGHSTMTEALEKCPWMEVALRRLFAIMYYMYYMIANRRRSATSIHVLRGEYSNCRCLKSSGMASGAEGARNSPYRQHSSTNSGLNVGPRSRCDSKGDELSSCPQQEAGFQAISGRQDRQTEVNIAIKGRRTTHSVAVRQPRQRTFPLTLEVNFLSDCLTTCPHGNNSPLLDISSCVKTVANVLDRLYSGPSRAVFSNPSSTSAALRSIRSIAARTASIPPNLHSSDDLESRAQSMHPYDRTDDLKYDIVIEGRPHSTYFPARYDCAQLEMRGSFMPLDCRRVDLPHAGTGQPEFWMDRLPFEIQKLFDPGNSEGIQSVLLRSLSSGEENFNHSFPRSRLHCIPGHYGKILDMADKVGMIEWSPLATEDSSYKFMASHLTMSSFAVRKDAQRDRMISWPRTKNEMMPDPPYVDLPEPSNFGRLRMPDNADLQAFYFDIENMFHNIRLPSSMVKLFPLRPVCFGDLPGTLQRRIETNLRYHPKQNERFRPLQATLSMGFKWAVYIAHNFAKSFFRQAYATFIASSNRIRLMYGIKSFSRSSGIITLTKGDALHMHIIDDINVVCVGWSTGDVSDLHRICESIFTENGLPVKRSKSTALGTTESTTLKFIGWVWKLKEGIVQPRADKLMETLALTVDYFSKANQYRQADVLRIAEKIVGRLVWICMGCRPLLSTLLQTFFALENARRSRAYDNLLVDAVRSELYNLAVLSPYAHVNLRRTTWTTVICVDASERAGAVVYCTAPLNAIDNLILAFEHYRSISRQTNRRRGINADSSQRALAIPTALWRKRIQKFVEEQIWVEAFTHVWRRKEHINSLEAASALFGLEWAVSHPITGSRTLILSDSMVVIGALSKGCSSSKRLSLYCRRFCAILIAHDVSVNLCYVPTECNPADGPSRGHSVANACPPPL